jgi:hypothetical protein
MGNVYCVKSNHGQAATRAGFLFGCSGVRILLVKVPRGGTLIAVIADQDSEPGFRTRNAFTH